MEEFKNIKSGDIIFVCCGSYREFVSCCNHYCRELKAANVTPRYLDDADQLRFTRNPVVVFYGNWFKRKDIFYIKELIFRQTCY